MNGPNMDVILHSEMNTMDYHYDETLSNRESSSQTSSLRSLFGSTSKSQLKSIQKNLTDSIEINEVNSDEENDEELLPCVVPEYIPKEERKEIERQCSERSQEIEKKKKNSLKVEDRCGKPLNCSVMNTLHSHVDLLGVVYRITRRYLPFYQV